MPEYEYTLLRLKSEVITALAKDIQESRLTQKAWADRHGISQSRVSSICNERLSDFSLDLLVRLATKAEMRIGIWVGP